MGNRAKRAAAKRLQLEQNQRRHRRLALLFTLLAVGGLVGLVWSPLRPPADSAPKTGSVSTNNAGYGPEDVTRASQYGINYRTVKPLNEQEVQAGYGHQSMKADYVITKFRDVSDAELLNELWRVLADRGIRPESTEPRLREYFQHELEPLGATVPVSVTVVPQVHDVEQPMDSYHTQAARQCQREIAGYLQAREHDRFGLVIENVWCLETGVLDRKLVMPEYITQYLPNKAALLYAIDHPGMPWDSATPMNLMKYADVVKPVMYRDNKPDLEVYEVWQEFRSRVAACQAVYYAREWKREVVLVYGVAHYPSILQTLQRYGAQVRVWLPSRFR